MQLLEINERPEFVERAYLVGTRPQALTRADADEHLDELAQLVDTMGVPVVGREVAPLKRPKPALLVGSGKAQEIVDECRRLEVDCLIFDDDISPTQQRNWEKLAEICVIDRQEVILDIFAQRAQTREARLQIRLARLEYSLPRLRRAWTHLERQRGGTGVRGGAGELQLETDQRIVRDQITAVKRDLALVRQRRETQRKRRGLKPTPNAAIVGYTNAGKSSLLRAMSGADAHAEDKLFATLDPLTRRVVLPNNQELLLTDTVGFIRKLPHHLVEAFKSTLEETNLADYLVHVADVSHSAAREQIDATNAVLDELGALDKPTILALNKVDLLDDRARLAEFVDLADRVIGVSAESGEGVVELLAALAELRGKNLTRLILRIPADRYDVVSLCHREGQVFTEGFAEGHNWIDVDFPTRLRYKVETFEELLLPDDLA